MSRYPATVRYGSKTGDVKLLQEKLNERTIGEVNAYVGSAYLSAGKVTSNSLVVRDSPSTSGKQIGTLYRGEVVQTLGGSGVWTKIRYGTKKVAVTGVADDATISLLKSYQNSKGLISDGICGEKTWETLLTKCTYYRQNDPRWTKTRYSSTGTSSQTIGSSGCGPTSMAMIVDTFSKSVDPPTMCKLALDNGFRTANSGTSWGYFAFAAKKYGLKCKQTSSLSEVLSALDRGALVVASMGVGYYTKGGHYIVLWTRNKYTKTIYTLDPASANRPSCSETLMSKESKQFFIIEK